MFEYTGVRVRPLLRACRQIDAHTHARERTCMCTRAFLRARDTKTERAADLAQRRGSIICPTLLGLAAGILLTHHVQQRLHGLGAVWHEPCAAVLGAEAYPEQGRLCRGLGFRLHWVQSVFRVWGLGFRV